MPLLHPAFDALQWAGFDSHSRTFADIRRDLHNQSRFQRSENLSQLPRQRSLIKNLQQIRDKIILTDSGDVALTQLKEDVTWEERLVEYD